MYRDPKYHSRAIVRLARRCRLTDGQTTIPNFAIRLTITTLDNVIFIPRIGFAILQHNSFSQILLRSIRFGTISLFTSIF